MDGMKASNVFPYLRSCKQECDKPIEGERKGEIPKWLKGCLIRVGSGLLEIGAEKFNHIFDGMALMHRFGFQDGKVTYQSRFLRSDSYCNNMRANKIISNEFATRGAPDPCKTIFQRFSSLFTLAEATDNDLVNIVLFSDEAYACTETNNIWKIDPDTLESLKKVNLSNYVPIQIAIAHTHEDTDGTVYNVGTSYGLRCYYNILKFPPKKNQDASPFDKASVVGMIPVTKPLHPCYHHSFGMTENYFIFVEQPFYISFPKMVWAHFISGMFDKAMNWDGNSPCRFHVVRKSDGQLLDTAYVSRSFFVFHHINAYEEDGHLIFDLCGYEKGEIIQTLYVKALENLFNNPKTDEAPFESRAMRFVLPLEIDKNSKDTGKNLVTLSKTEATAHLQSDGSVFCKHEVLTGSDPWSPELPRINYERCNGRKYRYFYSMARNDSLQRTHLIKVDTETKTTIPWSERGAIPSEPVFISNPNPQDQYEDSGVLLASLLFEDDESKVAIVVLDARAMKEIGRVTYKTESSVPGDFHGTFIQKHKI